MKKFLIFFLATTLTCTADIIPDACSLTIETPALKERSCRKIRLENGLEALLISDPHSPQSGAALAVNVGSWDDPKDRPGMAHFVEHLLFLGTQKYPEEEGYSRYLDEHGGSRNAFTQSDRTVYFFSVNHAGFDEALDRFGQFFIHPLFNPSGVEREAKAIHQEFCKNLPVDAWRILHVQKALSCEDHPFHCFGMGNQHTLSHISQEELQTWYHTHYGSQLMHLVAIAPKSLDELEEQVTLLFGDVKKSSFTPTTHLPPLINPQDKGAIVAISPVQQVQTLELAWELSEQDLQVQADQLVAYILGHEAQGSLLAILKDQGLASQLSAYSVRVGKNQKMFTLSIQLTDQGLKEYEKIIGICFQVIARYRLTGIPRIVFEEMKQCNVLNYTYQSRKEVAEFVASYAAAMIDEPLETFPEQSLIPTYYDCERTEELLGQLSVDNCLITLCASPKKGHFKPDRKEIWMDVDYTIKPITQKKLKSWALSTPHPIAQLPKPNIYLPMQFDLKQATTALTPLRFSSERGECYIQQDQEFQIPQISWIITIKTPAIHPADAKSRVLADLFCHAIEQELNHDAYLAALGGLHFSLSPESNGIRLTLEGFHDKAQVLLDKIWNLLMSGAPSKKAFAQYKELAERCYFNESIKSPLSTANELMLSVLYQNYSPILLKAQSLKNITYKDMVAFAQNVRHQNYIEAFLYGNLTFEEGETLWRNLSSLPNKVLSYPPSAHVQQSVAQFNQPHLIHCNSALAGHAVILATDLGPFSFKRRAAMDILCKGLEEPFFSDLRTKQQTAYLVRNWGEEIERHLYAFFAIQSSSHTPDDLLDRFEQFLSFHLENIQSEAIPKERFETIQASLIERLKNPADSLETKGRLLNRLAFEYDADFDWLDKRIEAMRALTYEEFVSFASEFLDTRNPKQLAICLHGLQSEPDLPIHTSQCVHQLRTHLRYLGRKESKP